MYWFDLTFFTEWHVISGLQKRKEHLETIKKLKGRSEDPSFSLAKKRVSSSSAGVRGGWEALLRSSARRQVGGSPLELRLSPGESAAEPDRQETTCSPLPHPSPSPASIFSISKKIHLWCCMLGLLGNTPLHHFVFDENACSESM